MKKAILHIITIVSLFSILCFSCDCREPESLIKNNYEPVEMTIPEQDADGWTVINESADSRIIYVSSSTGLDSNNGLSEAAPVQTIEHGMDLIRDGYPDHLLLNKGDVWEGETLTGWNKSGRSAAEPIVVSSYGTGSRPLFQANSCGISLSGRSGPEHVWFIGIDCYCSFGDSSSPDYDPEAERNSGFNLVGEGSDILIEDCVFRHYRLGLAIQRYTGEFLQDIKIRRCIVTDSYSTTSHSQGFFASKIDGLLVEECLFDHNGWLIQGDGGTQTDGMATMFNHNTYYFECNQVYMRGNLFLRPSSMGSKMCSDTIYGTTYAVFDNNLYYDGEIGISIGGNAEDMPYRFNEVEIINNVTIEIGKSNTTNRNFSWGLDIQDNKNTRVANNCFTVQGLYDNSYAVNLGSISMNNVSIQDNVMYEVNGAPVIVRQEDAWYNIKISGNIIDDAGNGWRMCSYYNSFQDVSFSGNTYSSGISNPFRLNNEYLTFSDWISASSEKGAVSGYGTFTDPGRTLESYHVYIGGSGSLDDFILRLREQSKDNWDPAYTAAAVNDYIRDGYDMETIGSVY